MFVRILQNAFPEYDQVLVWILDCRVLLLHHLNHVVPKLCYVLFVRLYYILWIYIETPQVPKLSLFLSLHNFFHALLILTVEGEYGMKLALVTASDRNAYTQSPISLSAMTIFFAVLWIQIRTYGMFMVSSESVIIYVSRSGSGSFHQQAKKSERTLNFTIVWPFIFEEWCKFLQKLIRKIIFLLASVSHRQNSSISIRILIRKSVVRIPDYCQISRIHSTASLNKK